MTYIVQKGDTLFKIAQRFNKSLDFILTTNPQITDPDLIYPGQTIVIAAGTEKCPLLRQGDRGPAVSRFQTLLKIAYFNPGPVDGIFGPRTKAALMSFQKSQKELELTGVADEETWTALGAECGPRPEVLKYIVRPGDSLFIISTRFNISIQSILNNNPQITNPYVIFAGQIISIPAN